MANNKHIVKFWRGTRESYNIIANGGGLDYWTRYSVKEVDGSRSEYFGENLISCPSGQFLPVLDIVSTLPNNLKPGDRYIVGEDANAEGPAEYYIVTIDADKTMPNGLSYRTEILVDNGGLSIRVIRKQSMAYQLVDGKLITYDQVDGGTY